MLKMRQEELRQHVQEEMGRLERVEARLKQIEQETFMADYDWLPVHWSGARDLSRAAVYPREPDRTEHRNRDPVSGRERLIKGRLPGY